MVWLESIISVVVVSLVAVLAAIPFLLKKQVSQKVLLVLLSVSVGTLLGGVFIHFLPEMAHEHGFDLKGSLFILIGFLVFFIIEKWIHHHHDTCKDHKHPEGHSHGYHLAPMNIIGDAVHNFIDGMVIAGAYLASTALGVAATISVIFHEIPQEIADFGVLLYAGLSKKKALFFNFISALTAIIGAVVAILLADAVHGFEEFILPFAAGSFLYIAASNLLPELHRHCDIDDTLIHIVSIVAGIAIMVLIKVFLPGAH